MYPKEDVEFEALYVYENGEWITKPSTDFDTLEKRTSWIAKFIPLD